MSPHQASLPDDDPVLREALKRCSPATYYAACKFRANGHPDDLRAIVLGVVERFVERDLRAKLHGPAEAVDALRLNQELGLDSLTLMEIVMIAEEVLPITISNEELTRLGTLGQVQHFIAAKVAAPQPPRAPLSPDADDWNVAAVGEQLRPLEAPTSRRLHPLPSQSPNRA